MGLSPATPCATVQRDMPAGRGEPLTSYVQLVKPLWLSHRDFFYRHGYSRHCSRQFSYGTIWENLLKHQDILSLAVVSFIHMTDCACVQVMIMYGEITCWSLLGFKGLSES